MRGERGERRELSGVITKGDEKDKGREKGQAANGRGERKIHKVERRLRGCERCILGRNRRKYLRGRYKGVGGVRG